MLSLYFSSILIQIADNQNQPSRFHFSKMKPQIGFVISDEPDDNYHSYKFQKVFKNNYIFCRFFYIVRFGFRGAIKIQSKYEI